MSNKVSPHKLVQRCNLQILFLIDCCCFNFKPFIGQWTPILITFDFFSFSQLFFVSICFSIIKILVLFFWTSCLRPQISLTFVLMTIATMKFFMIGFFYVFVGKLFFCNYILHCLSWKVLNTFWCILVQFFSEIRSIVIYRLSKQIFCSTMITTKITFFFWNNFS